MNHKLFSVLCDLNFKFLARVPTCSYPHESGSVVHDPEIGILSRASPTLQAHARELPRRICEFTCVSGALHSPTTSKADRALLRV